LEDSYGLSTDAVKDDIREWCTTFGEDELPSSLTSGALNERRPRRPPHFPASR
jgi:hypothetical protein